MLGEMRHRCGEGGPLRRRRSLFCREGREPLAGDVAIGAVHEAVEVDDVSHRVRLDVEEDLVAVNGQVYGRLEVGDRTWLAQQTGAGLEGPQPVGPDAGEDGP